MFKDKVLKFIHPAIIKILSAGRKFDLTVEGTIPAHQQCIFVANHFCIHDIPTAGEIVGEHTYVLVSDEDKYTISGLALSMNGVIWVNRLSRISRTKARERIITHLKAGHNILMYPEATWNLTSNLPMLPMNWGVIGISKETNVPIVPIYLLFSDKVCRAKVGEPYYPVHDNIEAITELRDKMATMCFDLLAEQPVCSREEIPSDYAAISIMKRYDEYSRAKRDPEGVMEYESQFIYKPKNVTDYDDVFAHLNYINPKFSNAFLFNRRNHN